MKDTNDGISRKMLGEENSVNKEEWDVFWCKEQGCNYYHNPVTLEVRWDNPNKPKVKFVDDDGIDDSVIAHIVDYSGEKTIKHKNRRSSTGKAKDKQDVVAAEIKDEHLHTTDSNNNNEENSKNLNKDHGTSSKNEWKTHYSKYNDCDFYENTITGEVVWDIPDGLKEDTSNNNDSAVSHKDQDDFSPMKDFTITLSILSFFVSPSLNDSLFSVSVSLAKSILFSFPLSLFPSLSPSFSSLFLLQP